MFRVASTFMLAACILILSACSTTKVEEISERIKSSCAAGNTCQIRIRDLTTFEWDRMYVFDYSAELYDIEQALGTPFPDFVQFKRRIVFLKNGNIVYREDQPTNIEKHLDGEVFFAIPDTEVYRQFTPDTAIFKVERKPIYDGVYYELKQAS